MDKRELDNLISLLNQFLSVKEKKFNGYYGLWYEKMMYLLYKKIYGVEDLEQFYSNTVMWKNNDFFTISQKSEEGHYSGGTDLTRNTFIQGDGDGLPYLFSKLIGKTEWNYSYCANNPMVLNGYDDIPDDLSVEDFAASFSDKEFFSIIFSENFIEKKIIENYPEIAKDIRSYFIGTDGAEAALLFLKSELLLRFMRWKKSECKKEDRKYVSMVSKLIYYIYNGFTDFNGRKFIYRQDLQAVYFLYEFCDTSFTGISSDCDSILPYMMLAPIVMDECILFLNRKYNFIQVKICQEV